MPVYKTADFGRLVMMATKNCLAGRIVVSDCGQLDMSVTDEHRVHLLNIA